MVFWKDVVCVLEPGIFKMGEITVQVAAVKFSLLFLPATKMLRS